MNELARISLTVAKEIQDEVPKRGKPPAEGLEAESEQIIPFSVVKGTRGYLEKIVNQINGTYERGWFDSCSVMIRRLIEILIIEVFEHFKIDNKIKDVKGDFVRLDDLINKALEETTWNLEKKTKKVLPQLKTGGNLSAHSRRYIAHRADLDKYISDLRVAVQELLFLSGLK